MRQRVLLTGITSYPGRELAKRLLAEGAEVHAIVRATSDLTRLNGVEGAILHVSEENGGNLADIIIAANPQVVFHLAGRYVRDHNSADIGRLIEDNILFGTRFLEAMRHAGVRHMVNTGSYFQHRDGAGRDPVNLYAAAKWAFEDILDYYTHAFDIEAATLVLYDTYGPGDWRWRLMQAIRAAQESGKPVPLPAVDMPMNFVYIDDVSAAFIRTAQLLAEKPESIRGKRFAVRPERPNMIEEIVATWEQVGGRPIARHWGGYALPERGVVEPWQGPPVPGWRPRVSLDEGIRRLLAEP